MPDLIETVEHGVATLTLNRPGSLNALSEDIRPGLLEANRPDRRRPRLLRRRRREVDGRSLGACVRGEGGGDAAVEPDTDADACLPKAIIGLATACDLRIAGRSARFGTGFVRIGLSGDWGGTWALTRLVGTAKARELVFTGDMIGAEEALRIGLVNRVVEDAELADVTMALARRIAAMPLVALGYAKRKLAAAETGDFAASLELEAVHPGTLFPDRGPSRGGCGVQGEAPACVQGVDLGTV